jgi:hypothetical protein
MKEIQDMFPELCNGFNISQQFLKILGDEIDQLRADEQAHEHGESPTLGWAIEKLKQEHLKADTLIAGIPVWQVFFDALFEMIADNNRQLLKAVGSLSSGQPHA